MPRKTFSRLNRVSTRRDASDETFERSFKSPRSRPVGTQEEEDEPKTDAHSTDKVGTFLLAFFYLQAFLRKKESFIYSIY